MSNIIDSIQLSGTTYQIQGSGGGVPENVFTAYTASTDSRIGEDEEVTAAALNALDEKIDSISGGGNPTVEVTQAEYDAMVSAGTVSADTYYIITDAQAGDLTQYWTSAQTQSAITQAVSGKQDTLVSGTNIKTINNESLLGSGNIDIQGGGGKAIEAGRGISITTGETADTVSFNLPISADTDGSTYKLLVGSGNTTQYSNKNTVIGDNNNTYGQTSSRIFSGATIIGYNNSIGLVGTQNDNNSWSTVIGRRNTINGGNGYIIGLDNKIESVNRKINNTYVIGKANSCNSVTSDVQNIYIFGAYNKVTKSDEFALGEYNVSSNDGTTSGNTLFSIGNGTADNARHNAFEIRQNGDIYITSGGTDIKLQDNLGGGSITVDTALDSGSTNPVENRVIYNKIDEVEQVTAAALNNINDRLSEDEEVTAAGLNALNDNLGGLKFVKLTQAEYNALATKDPSTLYIIVN